MRKVKLRSNKIEDFRRKYTPLILTRGGEVSDPPFKEWHIRLTTVP